MSPNILRNIKKVEAIESRYLANVRIIPDTGVFLSYWRSFEEIQITGHAEVEISSRIENNSRIMTAKLTFHSPETFDVANRHLSFRLTTVTGAQYLLGTNIAPYCVVNTTDLYPSETTARGGCTIVAEYTNTSVMLPILDR